MNRDAISWGCWRGQTLEMLEKKEKVLQKKIAMEIEKAKEFSRVKNKRGEPSSLLLTSCRCLGF